MAHTIANTATAHATTAIEACIAANIYSPPVIEAR